MDFWDSGRGIYYACNPSRTAYMTPDGIDPASAFELFGTATIPPPAPYRSDRDYSSDPDWTVYIPASVHPNPKLFEYDWNHPSYRHDVCYGSQLGRLTCDVKFWDRMSATCTVGFVTRRATCYFLAKEWYFAVRFFGGPSYKPRTSSSQPAGVPW